MSRIARNAYNTNCFHVIVQGIAREYIFGSSRLKEEYLNDISLYKEEYAMKILGYCIMDNHAHFLIYSPNVENLGSFMRKVNTRFAQYYNLVNERVGYVFRDRFKSQAIFDTKYALNCLNYIHLNPQNAGIVGDYRIYCYSSFGCYMNHSGIVDFSAAAELYDTSPENIAAIHAELGDDCPTWQECDEHASEEREKSVLKILKNLPLPAEYLKSDRAALATTVKKLHAVGVAYREIGEMFGISTSFAIKLGK